MDYGVCMDAHLQIAKYRRKPIEIDDESVSISISHITLLVKQNTDASPHGDNGKQMRAGLLFAHDERMNKKKEV